MLDVPILRLNPDDMVPRVTENYVDVGLMSLFDDIAWKVNVTLNGPKGSGKTMAAEQWAALNGFPIVRENCNENTNSRNLIGGFQPKGGDTFFVAGSLTNAIMTANEDGGCLLILDEFNSLTPGIQKSVNSVVDHRHEVTIAKLGRVFRLKRGRKLWCVATMNPKYAGTYALNTEMKSRWVHLDVKYPSREVEREIMFSHFTRTPSASDKVTVEKMLTIAGHTRAKGTKIDYALSTRDLCQFVTLLEIVGLKKALKLTSNKLDTEESRKEFASQVWTAWEDNIDLSKVQVYGV